VKKHAAKNHANGTFPTQLPSKTTREHHTFPKPPSKKLSKIAENHSTTSRKFYFANLAFF
jgi:hypothetical protein